MNVLELVLETPKIMSEHVSKCSVFFFSLCVFYFVLVGWFGFVVAEMS